MTDTPPPSGRDSRGRFGPGNPGRPPGSRNLVSRKLLLEIHRDFEAHKAGLLNRLRSTCTPTYFSTLAPMLPQMAQTDVSDFEDYSDEDAARLVNRLRQMFAVTTDPRTALAEREAILASDQAEQTPM